MTALEHSHTAKLEHSYTSHLERIEGFGQDVTDVTSASIPL